MKRKRGKIQNKCQLFVNWLEKTKKDGFWERKSLKIRLAMVGIKVQIPPECDDIFFSLVAKGIKWHGNRSDIVHRDTI